MRCEGLAITRRPIIHIRNENEAPIVGETLRRNPHITRDQWRPGSVNVSAMIVVTDDIAILLFVEWPLRLMPDEIIRKAWAMNHLFGAKILNEIIAGDSADDRKMIIVFCFGLVRSAAGYEL